MDAAKFIELYGRKEAEKVAAAAGTVYQYLYQISKGYRRPSPEKAKRLVEASNHRMDFVSLLTAEKRGPAKPRNAEHAVQ